MPDIVWVVQFLISVIVSGLVYDRQQTAKELKQVKDAVAGLHSQHATIEVRVDSLREILELKIDAVDKNVMHVLTVVKEMADEQRQSNRE